MKKKHRALHTFDARGHCTRCGRSRHVHEPQDCPPGFWMTPYEKRTWESLPELERPAFQRWARAS